MKRYAFFSLVSIWMIAVGCQDESNGIKRAARTDNATPQNPPQGGAGNQTDWDGQSDRADGIWQF